MRTVLILSGLALLSSWGSAVADNYVRGYTRGNGTYVQPHYQTAPNTTKFDNYSTKGNFNPYTGKAGTVDPYKVPSYGSYGQRR